MPVINIRASTSQREFSIDPENDLSCLAMSDFATTKLLHPYYPVGISLSGDVFIPNDWDVARLILTFAAGWAAIFAVTLVLVRKIAPNLKTLDQAVVLWFVLSRSSS